MMDITDMLDMLIFPIDVMLAVAVYIFPIYKVKRDRILPTTLLSIGSIGLFLSILFVFRLTADGTTENESFRLPQVFLFLTCYCIFFSILLLLAGYLFQVVRSDLFFIGLAAYALQHIAYVLIHEIIAALVGFDWNRSGLIYIFVSIFCRWCIYRWAYRIFCEKIRHTGAGNLTPNRSGKWIYLATLLLLILQTVPNQGFFLSVNDERRYVFAVSSVLLCALVLYAQYMTIQSIHQAQEQYALEHLLEERQKQYRIEKDAIDLINFKSHDLKNQLLALKDSTNLESQDFYKEVMATIHNYDQVMNLEDETLNTLLTQKRYYCQKQGIHFTHMTDGAKLTFIRKMDLYTILGNALDNAIECVESYEDTRYRQVTLRISAYKGFIRMQVVNPFLGHVEWDRDTLLPQTSKDNKASHGFGLRSIQLSLQQYDGWLSVKTDNQLFTLNIMVPLPREEDE